MKMLLLPCSLLAHLSLADQWSSYEEFEADATNALANMEVLMSAEYTNRLSLCREELGPTNEMASAALLMLAISDDAKSIHMESFVGNTNALAKAAWLMNSTATGRTLWQKSCAIAMLATDNADSAAAVRYFCCATNALHQWDSTPNSFSGGDLSLSIARYFGAPELTPRSCLVFAAASSAKTAGMAQEFAAYANMLPIETQAFLTEQ